MIEGPNVAPPPRPPPSSSRQSSSRQSSSRQSSSRQSSSNQVNRVIGDVRLKHHHRTSDGSRPQQERPVEGSSSSTPSKTHTVSSTRPSSSKVSTGSESPRDPPPLRPRPKHNNQHNRNRGGHVSSRNSSSSSSVLSLKTKAMTEGPSTEPLTLPPSSSSTPRSSKTIDRGRNDSVPLTCNNPDTSKFTSVHSATPTSLTKTKMNTFSSKEPSEHHHLQHHSLPYQTTTTQSNTTTSQEPLQVTKNNNYRPHLHALHRIRRERQKGLVFDEEANFMKSTRPSRPSIINRNDIFHRFGEKEREAIEAFNFLDELIVSSCPSSPIKGCTNTVSESNSRPGSLVLDETFPYTFTESPDMEQQCHTSPFKSYTWSKWTSRQRTRSRSRSQQTLERCHSQQSSNNNNRVSNDSLEITSPMISPQHDLATTFMSMSFNHNSATTTTSPPLNNQTTSTTATEMYLKNVAEPTTSSSSVIHRSLSSRSSKELRRPRSSFGRCQSYSHEVRDDGTTTLPRPSYCRKSSDDNLTTHRISGSSWSTCSSNENNVRNDSNNWSMMVHRNSLSFDISPSSNGTNNGGDDSSGSMTNNQPNSLTMNEDVHQDDKNVDAGDDFSTKLEVSQLLHALERLSFEKSSSASLESGSPPTKSSPNHRQHQNNHHHHPHHLVNLIDLRESDV